MGAFHSKAPPGSSSPRGSACAGWRVAMRRSADHGPRHRLCDQAGLAPLRALGSLRLPAGRSWAPGRRGFTGDLRNRSPKVLDNSIVDRRLGGAEPLRPLEPLGRLRPLPTKGPPSRQAIGTAGLQRKSFVRLSVQVVRRVPRGQWQPRAVAPSLCGMRTVSGFRSSTRSSARTK
jgi:hypothetical protein